MRKLASTMFGVIALTLCAPNTVVAVPMTSGMGATTAAAAQDQLATPIYYRRGGGYRIARYGGYYGGYRRYGYYGGYYRPWRSYAYSYPNYYGGYGYPYYASYSYPYYASYYPYYASYGYPYYRYGYRW